MKNSIFLHIPKTAGLSIRDLFRNLINGDNVTEGYMSWGKHTVSEDKAHEWRNKILVQGHISWNDYERFFGDRFVFTFLREPVERCLSWYYHAKYADIERYIHLVDIKDVDGQSEGGSLARQLDATRFFNYKHVQIEMNADNRMTWQLGHDSNPHKRNISAIECLERAKQNLHRIDFIGFYDDLENDVRKLMKTLDLPEDIELPRTNVTQGKKDYVNVPDDTIDRLKVLTEYDRQLYVYAKKINNVHSENKS